MSHHLESETKTHFVVRDSKGSFKVPKAGLSDAMVRRIRAMGVQRKADGGGVGLPAGTNVNDLPSGAAARPTMQAAEPAFVPGEEAFLQGTPVEPYQAAPSKPPAGFVRESVAEKQPQQPQQEAQPPQPAGGAPAGMGVPKVYAPKVAGVEVPKADVAGFERAQATELSAAEQAAKVAEQMGAAEAGAAIGRQKVMEAHALKEADIHAKAQQAAQTWLDKSNAISQEIANMDATVDPGRYWASRSTAGKISAIIGLALGAIGAGTDGVNRAAMLLNQAVDRDLDAQKAEHEIRLRKGQAAMEQARTMYGMQRQISDDALQAHNAAKTSALASVDAQLAKTIAGLKDPQAKANLEQLRGKMQMEAVKYGDDAKAKAYDEAVKQQQIGLQQAGLSLQAQEANQRAAMQAMGAAGAGAGAAGAPSKKQLEDASDMLTERNKMTHELEKIRAMLPEMTSGTYVFSAEKKKLFAAAVKRAAGAAERAANPGSVVSLNELANRIDTMGLTPGQFMLNQKEINALINDSIESADAQIRDVYGRFGLALPKYIGAQSTAGEKPNMANYNAAMQKAGG